MAIYFHLSMVPVIQVSCPAMVIVLKGVLEKIHMRLIFAIFADEANLWKFNAAKIFILIMI